MSQYEIGSCQFPSMKYFDIGKGMPNRVSYPRVEGIVLNRADQRGRP